MKSQGWFLRYFTHRRKQLQDWEAAAPSLFGAFMLMLAGLEISLGLGVVTGGNQFQGLMIRWAGLLIILIFIEGLIVKLGFVTARLLKKDGSQLTALTFLNIGLLPLNLFLPFVLLILRLTSFHGLAYIFIFLLLLQVFSNWRESLEIAFELTSFESSFVLYAAGLVVWLIGWALAHHFLHQTVTSFD